MKLRSAHYCGDQLNVSTIRTVLGKDRSLLCERNRAALVIMQTMLVETPLRS